MLEPICYRRHVFHYRFIARKLLYVHHAQQVAWPIASNFHNYDGKTYRHSNTHQDRVPSSILVRHHSHEYWIDLNIQCCIYIRSCTLIYKSQIGKLVSNILK
jgi:hypothetical protein